MDDDIKNLFQKFGKSGEAYKEINREEVNEQAKQRWPLLRDVHINAAPVYPLKKEKTDGPPPAEVAMEMTRPVAANPVRAEPAVTVVNASARPIFPERTAAVPSSEEKTAEQIESALPGRYVDGSVQEIVPVSPVSPADQSLSAVFARLLGSREDIRPVDPGPSSFFKKIFKP